MSAKIESQRRAPYISLAFLGTTVKITVNGFVELKVAFLQYQLGS
jgi:hypothetical protein